MKALEKKESGEVSIFESLNNWALHFLHEGKITETVKMDFLTSSPEWGYFFGRFRSNYIFVLLPAVFTVMYLT